MLLILMMFSVAALHFMSIWSLKVRLKLRCSPKYLTLVDLLINSPNKFIVVWVVMLSSCLLLK